MTDSILTLSATATRVLKNDTLSIQFFAEETGRTAQAVQEALKLKLTPATALARTEAKNFAEDVFTVETSDFSVSPTYDKNSKINGYTGSVSLTVTSTDIPAITALAVAIKTMTIASLSNSVSRKARTVAEADLAIEGIKLFNGKAKAYAAAFGFGSYKPTNVAVQNSNGNYPRGGARVAMASAMMESAPLEIESGKTEISVTVQGSISMLKSKAKTKLGVSAKDFKSDRFA